MINRYRGSFFWGLIFVFFVVDQAAGAELFGWGGSGSDPALKKHKTHRYSVHPGGDDTGVEIVVDAEKIMYSGTRRVDLVTQNDFLVSSNVCSKKSKHVTAPTTCSFSKADVKSLSGMGRIKVFDSEGLVVLDDAVDFDVLGKSL
jgi:hypothetical protein